MNEKLLAALRDCVRLGASDLHVSSNAPLYVRRTGELEPLSDPVVTEGEAEEMILSLLGDDQRDVLRQTRNLDIAFSIPGDVRFRGHVYSERNGLVLAARRLDDRFRSLRELGLPGSLVDLARLPDGLVLFTGPTGSGKSTSLATLIDRINRERACHILTIEDPIEYLHRNRRSLVHQRELYSHVSGFADAVRESLREDPDVVLVGEMRDRNTMRAAITVAETGHLVFSTLHCGNAVGALERIIGAFDSSERESLCQQLSMTLRAVVAQHLLPSADGKGRVPAVEILIVTRGVANLIRSGRPEQVYSAMEMGSEHGMQTLEQSLADLVGRGTISIDAARGVTDNQGVLKQRIGAVAEAAPAPNGTRRPTPCR